MLHLLEHAQIHACVSHLLHHSGTDARKEDDKRGMDHFNLHIFDVSQLYAVGNVSVVWFLGLDKALESIRKSETIGIGTKSRFMTVVAMMRKGTCFCWRL